MANVAELMDDPAIFALLTLFVTAGMLLVLRAKVASFAKDTMLLDLPDSSFESQLLENG